MGNPEKDFTGVKAALLFDNELVVFLRDNKPGLPFANMWDFPGGGREDAETPFECLKREVKEEFGISISGKSVVWQKEYPAMHDPSQRAFFCVVMLSQKEVASIVFGDEGQEWKLMSVRDCLKDENVVPHLKTRLQDYLDSTKVVGKT